MRLSAAKGQCYNLALMGINSRIARTAVLLALMSVCLVIVAEGARGRTGAITRGDVDQALANLTQGDEYRYREPSLEDPAIYSWLAERWRSLWERWSSSPISIAGSSGLNLLGAVLAVALIVAVGGLLMLRFARERMLGLAGASAGDGSGEVGGLDAWGDVGAGNARDLASVGKFRDALSVIFKSTLKGLNNLGWIRYRSSGPSRLYLRQLRRSAELYPLFRDLLWRFEIAYYGKQRAEEGDWTEVYGLYEKVARVASADRHAKVS